MSYDYQFDTNVRHKIFHLILHKILHDTYIIDLFTARRLSVLRIMSHFYLYLFAVSSLFLLLFSPNLPFTAPHRIIFHRIMSHLILYRTISCHIKSHHIISYYYISHHNALYPITSYHIIRRMIYFSVTVSHTIVEALWLPRKKQSR